MSQQEATPGPDPSMEDILASIRRILNDGEAEPGAAPASADAPLASSAGAVPAHAPPGALPAPAPPGALPDDDVFLLDQTMLIEEPAPMPPDAAPPPPPADEPIRPAEPAHDYSHLDAGEAPEEPLLAASTAAAAGASLGALVRVMGQRNTPVYRGGPTLEDMVRDEIRPLVKNWLDENLAPMVERLVRNEIERVTRGQ